MKGVRDVRELKPERGDIILLLNENPRERSAAGIFGEFYKNANDLQVFSFERGLYFQLPYKMSEIGLQSGLEKSHPRDKYGEGYPIRSYQEEPLIQNLVFYKGESDILKAIESSPLLFYLPFIRGFINKVREEKGSKENAKT